MGKGERVYWKRYAVTEQKEGGRDSWGGGGREGERNGMKERERGYWKGYGVTEKKEEGEEEGGG